MRRGPRHLILLLAIIGFAPPLLATPATHASAAPAIAINEFMARPSSGNPEWVELYNASPSDVDISGWKIDDSITTGTAHVIVPVGTILPSNGFYVITRTGDFLDNDDQVQLFMLDSSKKPTIPVDSYSYTGAVSALSYARIPDGSGPFVQGQPTQGSWNALPGPTAAPTYTPTPTNTPTSTPTSTPACTKTPAPTSTPTPTHTATPTPTPYPLGIVINEFLANAGTIYLVEWIELFNQSDAPADLGGWRLDDVSNGGSAPYTLPPGATIAPNGFLVIYQTESGVVLNDGGDTVRLLHPDGTLAAEVTYGASHDDISLSRSPEGAWYESTPSPGAANPPEPTNTPTHPATPAPTASATATTASYPADIVLSEFLAQPQDRYTDEWVELFNGGASDADLSGWQIDDGPGGGAPHTLPADTTVAAGGYLAIDLPTAILNNDGDTLRLLRPDGAVADSTSFSSSAADTSYSRGAQGEWYLSAEATPGEPNAGPATPTATWAPTETRTPTPTRTPSPTRTPTPTRIATATRTPAPTRSPTLTSTPRPTRTPAPTQTPRPTRTPAPTRTPMPTRTPSLARTFTPTRTPAPAQPPAQPRVTGQPATGNGPAATPWPAAAPRAGDAGHPGASPYALPAGGTLYRGVAARPTAARPVARGLEATVRPAAHPAQPAQPASGPPITASMGLLLIAAGSAVGYKQLRGRTSPAPINAGDEPAED